MQRPKRTSALLMLTVAAGYAILPSCASTAESRAVEDVKSQDRVLSRLRRENDELTAANRKLTTDVAVLQAEVDRFRSQAESYAKNVGDLETRLADLDRRFGTLSNGVTVSAHPEGYAYSVEGTLLFETGQARIRPEGAKLLREIVARLKEASESIRVEGHTDTQPVVNTIREFPLGNLQLSGARALHVADFLVREGVDAARVSYAGFGEHRPVADNASPAGMAKNRRVELVVLTAK